MILAIFKLIQFSVLICASMIMQFPLKSSYAVAKASNNELCAPLVLVANWAQKAPRFHRWVCNYMYGICGTAYKIAKFYLNQAMIMYGVRQSQRYGIFINKFSICIKKRKLNTQNPWTNIFIFSRRILLLGRTADKRHVALTLTWKTKHEQRIHRRLFSWHSHPPLLLHSGASF
jgi:hypothetical protein